MKKLSYILMSLLLMTIAHQASACYAAKINGPSTIMINSNVPYAVGAFSIDIDPTFINGHGGYLYTTWTTSVQPYTYTGDAVYIYFYRNLAPFTHLEGVTATLHFADGFTWETSVTVQVVVLENPFPPGGFAASGSEQNMVTILDDKGKVLKQVKDVSTNDPLVTEGLSPGLYFLENKKGKSVERKKIVIKQ